MNIFIIAILKSLYATSIISVISGSLYWLIFLMLLGHIFWLLHISSIFIEYWTIYYNCWVFGICHFPLNNLNFLLMGIYLLTTILILLRLLFKLCYGGYKIFFTLGLIYPYSKGMAFLILQWMLWVFNQDIKYPILQSSFAIYYFFFSMYFFFCKSLIAMLC